MDINLHEYITVLLSIPPNFYDLIIEKFMSVNRRAEFHLKWPKYVK
jgi:hypothetical protein